MTIKRRTGGSLVDIANVRRRSGSSWVTPSNVYRRSGNSWVKVWPTHTPVSATISPTSIYATHPLNTNGTLYGNATITASGGSGSYTVTNSSPTYMGISVVISGMQVSITATGRNTSLSQDLYLVVSDGTSSVTVVLPVQFDFGVVA